jgi:hypothetical protein
VRHVLLSVILIAAAYAYGALSHEHRWFPTPQIERALRRNIWHWRKRRGFKDTGGRTEVPCPLLLQPRTAVLLAFGQSNAANEGEAPYQPGEGVYNFNLFDGRCYVARDPLLGATGTGGSPWSRLGDKLIAAGMFERVLIVPIAVGASTVADWTPEGIHHARLLDAQRALAAHGLRIMHALWHQGEADALHTTREEYVARFRRLLDAMRAAGIDAPVYVAVASICRNRGSDAIRAAQREIAATLENVRPGPNTDALDRFVWRFDLCHFSTEGLDRHAELWLEALRSSGSELRPAPSPS